MKLKKTKLKESKNERQERIKYNLSTRIVKDKKKYDRKKSANDADYFLSMLLK